MREPEPSVLTLAGGPRLARSDSSASPPIGSIKLDVAATPGAGCLQMAMVVTYGQPNGDVTVQEARIAQQSPNPFHEPRVPEN